MEQEKVTLLKRKPPPANETHDFLLRIPMELYQRMIEEGGIYWGETTEYILDAIRQKLEKEGA